MEDWTQELEEYLNKGLAKIEIGREVEGTIVKIGEENTFVDIGLKGEAIVPTKEILDEEGNPIFKEGDSIKAIIRGRDAATGGVLLSYKSLRKTHLKNELKEAHQKGEPIKVKVIAEVKGGYRVRYKGFLEGFLPYSQSYFKKKPESPKELIGKELDVEILRLEDKSFVVSHRKVLEGIYNRHKQEVEQKLKKGEPVEGTVVKRTEGGFVVDIEGVFRGFLPDKELSWARIKKPETYLKIGQKVKVKPIFFDPGKERLKLSIKALLPDPWDGVEYRYQVGDKVKGKIVSVHDFGAFMEVEPGVEGLIPVSEIVWGRKVKPKEVLREEDEVEAIILELIPSNRRLLLSLKRIEPSPWEKFTNEVKPGDIVRGKIKKLGSYGALIEIREGVKGFLHISNISWAKIDKVEDVLHEGEELTLKVLNIDKEKKRVELSLKHLKPNPWEELKRSYKVGDLLEVKVKSIQEKGLRVEVLPELEGFIPISELFLEGKRISLAKAEEIMKEKFPPGQNIKVKIIELDPEKKKLVLSHKGYLQEQEKQAVKEFLKEEKKKGVLTLGEILAQKLKTKE